MTATTNNTNSSNLSSNLVFWGTSGTSGTSTVFSSASGGFGGCNESKKFDNEQKALFHGLKSAYRMSRLYDGEYGVQADESDDIPWETAARIAANVAIAYLETKDREYDRRESLEYIRDNHVEDLKPAYIERLVFTGRLDDGGGVDEEVLDMMLDHAWTQAHKKRSHYDAARTALAVSEAYLGVPLAIENDRNRED